MLFYVDPSPHPQSDTRITGRGCRFRGLAQAQPQAHRRVCACACALACEGHVGEAAGVLCTKLARPTGILLHRGAPHTSLLRLPGRVLRVALVVAVRVLRLKMPVGGGTLPHSY